MPNNSCTIILNGHGYYSKDFILDVKNTDYNIIFPCGLNERLSNGHHNLLLKTVTNNVPTIGLGLMESLPTSYISNKAVRQNYLNKDMFEKRTEYVYDHLLSFAPDVIDAQSLFTINQQRFVKSEITIFNNSRQWSGGINIEFDYTQVKNDITQKHQAFNYQYTTTVNFSPNSILYVTPIAKGNQKMELKLSELLGDILPKIKFPVSYHQNGTVDIIPCVFLDDNIQNKQQYFDQEFHNVFDITTDIYHELVISGDANIVWDAGRDLYVP